jgi:hypothetical protein
MSSEMWQSGENSIKSQTNKGTHNAQKKPGENSKTAKKLAVSISQASLV